MLPPFPHPTPFRTLGEPKSQRNYAQNTLKFINKDATSIHGNIRVGSIYTSESGEWKLAGFEVLSAVNDDEAIIYVRFEPRVLQAFQHI